MLTEDASRFRLGAITLPYSRWSFDRALEGVARAGFRHVGIRANHADGPVLPEKPTSADFAALRQRIESHGLIPEWWNSYYSATAPAQTLLHDVDIAAEMGIGALMLVPISPGPTDVSERMGAMDWFNRVEAWFRSLEPGLRRAERFGIDLLFKPHGGIAGTAADLALICERLGSPVARVAYDAGNVAYYEGIRPEADLPICADLVGGICIKDHRGGRQVVDFPTPGEGDIDHASLFRTLLDAGFDGPVLIERIDGLETAEDADRELARARTYLERVVAEVTAE